MISLIYIDFMRPLFLMEMVEHTPQIGGSDHHISYRIHIGGIYNINNINTYERAPVTLFSLKYHKVTYKYWLNSKGYLKNRIATLSVRHLS
jgi:hypothetical protein